MRDFILHLKWTLSFIFNCKLIKENLLFPLEYNFKLSYFYFCKFLLHIHFTEQNLFIKPKNKGPKKSDYFVLGIKKYIFTFYLNGHLSLNCWSVMWKVPMFSHKIFIQFGFKNARLSFVFVPSYLNHTFVSNFPFTEKFYSCTDELFWYIF